MVNKILVPIDFSNYSFNAAEVAISLGHLYEADLVLYAIHGFNSINTELIKSDATEQKLYELEKQFDFTGLKVSRVFGEGNFVRSIQKFIPKRDVDLVVMGSHGLSGFNSAVLGSNALQLLRKAPCPIIVTKNRIHNFSLNKVVFISNFDDSNFPPFEQFIEMVLPFNTEIHLLNIDTPGFFSDSNTIVKPAMDKFQKYAEEKGFSCHSHRRNSSLIETGIYDFIDHVKPDLVVIPTHDRSALQRLFISSLTEAVINQVDVPTMALKF